MINKRQTIKHLIETLNTSLEELYEAEKLSGHSEFRTGQIYAYAECLELLQKCKPFRRLGIDYEVERRYSIDITE